MRHRPRAITVATILIVAPLVVLAVWIGVDAALMPGCEGCHLTGEFGEQTRAGAHATVECSACHGGGTPMARVEFGVNQVLGMQLPVIDTDPSLSAVGADRCLACHAQSHEGRR